MKEKKKNLNTKDMPIIMLENVSKSYTQGMPALDNVTLNIKKGEFVFVVGDSGSGKSTLIKLLLREILPTSGRIYVNGTDVVRLRRHRIPKFRRQLGVVFQDFRLLQDRNVYENVAFAQRIIQKPGHEIKKNVPQILSVVGLAGKYKARPKQLSGGEQQRVAIARAVAKNPKLLLCDEPTGALDYKTGKQVLKVLQDMCFKEKMTVIMITHNGALADMGQKIIRVKSGHIDSVTVNPTPMNIEDIEY